MAICATASDPELEATIEKQLKELLESRIVYARSEQSNLVKESVEVEEKIETDPAETSKEAESGRCYVQCPIVR